MSTRDQRKPRLAPAARGALVALESVSVRLYADGSVEGLFNRLDQRSRRLVTEALFTTDQLPVGEHPMAELLARAARTHLEQCEAQLTLW